MRMCMCDTLEQQRAWSKSEATLLLGNTKDVRQINRETGQQHVVCDLHVHNAVAVDFDNANNAVFWADVHHKNITRSGHTRTGPMPITRK